MAYYSVHEFMYEDLDLKGTELNVFALIYSFEEYSGGLMYLSKAVGVSSLNTVQKALNSLLEKDYIVKVKKSPTKIVYTPNKKLFSIYSEPTLSKFKKPKGYVKSIAQSKIGEWE